MLPTWGVQFVVVKAKVLVPVFVPISRRTFSLESSPLVGEIVRFSGHLGHDRGVAEPFSLLAL